MIAANELRRGNYCLFDSTIDRVTEIYETGCNAEFKSRWSYDRIHPIPLTPEILEKAGFVNLGKGVLEEPYWQIHKFISLWKVGGNTSMYQLCCADKMLPCLPEYLHHLQNITHALTGQELTIKL